MIFGKKSCAPSDGLGFRQGQNIVHNVCGRKLGLIVQMAVDVRRGADVEINTETYRSGHNENDSK